MKRQVQAPTGHAPSTASRRPCPNRRGLALAAAAAGAVCGLMPVTGSLASGPPITGQVMAKYVFSPNYATDTTIWALTLDNVSTTPCDGNDVQPAPPCHNLYESTDGGTTWSWVPGPSGQDMTDVVLPSAYPSDPNVFVDAFDPTTDTGDVYRSSDGGSTWHAATWQSIGAGDDPTMSGVMSAQPGQPAGHDHIVLSRSQGTGFETYDEATGDITLGPTMPPGFVAFGSPVWADANTFFVMAYTPQEYAESLVGGVTSGSVVTVASPSPTPSEVVKCTLTSCTHVATVTQGGTGLAVSPDYGTDHTFAVWGSTGATSPTFAITQDGGSSFSTVSISGEPSGTAIAALTFMSDGNSGPRVAVSTAGFSNGFVSWVSDVDFSGGSYTVTSYDTSSFHTLQPLEAAPNDNLWAGALSGPGPECSSNGGSTWGVHC